MNKTSESFGKTHRTITPNDVCVGRGRGRFNHLRRGGIPQHLIGRYHNHLGRGGQNIQTSNHDTSGNYIVDQYYYKAYNTVP